MSINIRVTYENTPVRRCAAQCPKCKNWLRSPAFEVDIEHDLDWELENFHCPICGESFSEYNPVFTAEEVNYSEIYKDSVF